MRAQARGFFQHADAEVGFQLFEPDRAREAGGAGSDDGDLVLHDITLAFDHRIRTLTLKAICRRKTAA